MSALVHAVTAYVAAQDVVLAIVHTSCRRAVEARNAAETMLRAVLEFAATEPLAGPARAYLDAQTLVRTAHAERSVLGPLAPEGMFAHLLRLERTRDQALEALRAALDPARETEALLAVLLEVRNALNAVLPGDVGGTVAQQLAVTQAAVQKAFALADGAL